MGAEEAAREASPGHEKGEGKRDRRPWPALKQMQGGAGVYLYPHNYFHPEQPKVVLVKRKYLAFYLCTVRKHMETHHWIQLSSQYYDLKEVNWLSAGKIQGDAMQEKGSAYCICLVRKYIKMDFSYG